MALADIPTSAQPRRLDSWKEIAEYLGRDVRTATRWESQGLPLHRVPGGKGRSVFAFTTEIDDWMAGRQPGDIQATVMADPRPPPALARRAAPSRAVVVVVCCALGGTLAAAVMASRTWRTPLDAAAPRIVVTDSAVSIADASGATRVIHTFARSRRRQPPRFMISTASSGWYAPATRRATGTRIGVSRSKDGWHTHVRPVLNAMGRLRSMSGPEQAGKPSFQPTD